MESWRLRWEKCVRLNEDFVQKWLFCEKINRRTSDTARSDETNMSVYLSFWIASWTYLIIPDHFRWGETEHLWEHWQNSNKEIVCPKLLLFQLRYCKVSWEVLRLHRVLGNISRFRHLLQTTLTSCEHIQEKIREVKHEILLKMCNTFPPIIRNSYPRTVVADSSSTPLLPWSNAFSSQMIFNLTLTTSICFKRISFRQALARFEVTWDHWAIKRKSSMRSTIWCIQCRA